MTIRWKDKTLLLSYHSRACICSSAILNSLAEPSQVTVDVDRALYKQKGIREISLLLSEKVLSIIT